MKKRDSRKTIAALHYESNVPRTQDDRLMAWVIHNTSNEEIQLVSFLEKETALREMPEFSVVILKPNQRKTLPHILFTIHCESGAGTFDTHPAPKGTKFVYSMRVGTY